MAENYPKKYWWAVLVAVPVITAIIAIIPSFLKTGGGSTYISSTEFSGPMYFAEVSVVINEYEKSEEGKSLDTTLKQRIEEATNLVDAKDYAGALRLYEEIAQQVQLPSVYANLGALRAAEGKREAARQAYSEALKLNPNHQAAHLNLGILDQNEGRLEDALVHLERAGGLGQADKLRAEVQKETARDAHSREVEPNNDFFSATAIPLNAEVQATIADASDRDYFKFTTPAQYRDIVVVSIENRSMTLAPGSNFYSSDKSNMGHHYDFTRGANLGYRFSTEPGSEYYVLVHSQGGYGAYALVVKPLRAYDEYEQNESFQDAKLIALGKRISAGIMDGKDVDFYRIVAPPQASTIRVLIENRSMTLAPESNLYNSDKSHMGRYYDWTQGANLEYSFSPEPSSHYYISVHPQRGNGDYSLLVERQ